MDPDACLARFLDACHDDDREEAIAALEDLQEWLRKGGFLPKRWPRAIRLSQGNRRSRSHWHYWSCVVGVPDCRSGG